MPLPRRLQNRWGRLALTVLFWTVIVLFYSFRTGRLGQPITWVEALKLAMAQWYVWALLTPLIVRADRLLPVAPEALYRRLAAHVPLSLLTTIVYLYLNGFARALLNGEPGSFAFTADVLVQAMGGALHWNVLVYWVILGVYLTSDYYGNLRERQVRNAELERLLAQSRLETLRSQLHPHFLFNALNAVSSYVERDPRKARRMLEQLGELLRLSLDHTEAQEVRLEQEVAFLERYLAIQRVRYEDQLNVTMRIEPEVLGCLAPPFVLQPLVENAIVHGIAPRSREGNLEIAAWRDDGRLRLRVRDDGPGMPAGWKADSGQGVGIANTRERLRRLYGESNHEFIITSQPGAGVQVDLSLPFRDAEETDSASSTADGDHQDSHRR